MLNKMGTETQRKYDIKKLQKLNAPAPEEYSETSIYCSPTIRFPGSVVQFLWSLSESSTMAPASIVFPDPLFLFQIPEENDE
jgi:hypothetical protein